MVGDLPERVVDELVLLRDDAAAEIERGRVRRQAGAMRAALREDVLARFVPIAFEQWQKTATGHLLRRFNAADGEECRREVFARDQLTARPARFDDPRPTHDQRAV